LTAYELRRHLADMHDVELRGVSYEHLVEEHRRLHTEPLVATHTHPEGDDA